MGFQPALKFNGLSVRQSRLITLSDNAFPERFDQLHSLLQRKGLSGLE